MPLWNRFLDRYGGGWDAFEYDVRVGPASGAAAGADSATIAVWQALSRLRIDALAWRGEDVWIFEVKPYAGISTVGQLIGYRDLYVQDAQPRGAVQLAVVTDRFQPAVGEVFRVQGIEVWLV